MIPPRVDDDTKRLSECWRAPRACGPLSSGGPARLGSSRRRSVGVPVGPFRAQRSGTDRSSAPGGFGDLLFESGVSTGPGRCRLFLVRLPRPAFGLFRPTCAPRPQRDKFSRKNLKCSGETPFAVPNVRGQALALCADPSDGGPVRQPRQLLQRSEWVGGEDQILQV